MKRHPDESKLMDHLLEGGEDPALESHLESCASCREKWDRLERTRSLILSHEVPDNGSKEAEDVFASAWSGANEKRKPAPGGPWRWVVQPAGLFTAGLALGYLLFSGSETPPSPEVDRARPASPKSDSRETTIPSEQPGSDYWEMAGFRNAKFTPAVRYEEGRKVMGGRLEAETPGGALVVMNY